MTGLLAAACGGGTAAGMTTPSARHAPLPNQAPGAPVLTGADTVTMLHGGTATFTALSGLVDAATASVHVEMYEFSRSDMRDALIRAHDRGVAVSVIVDPTVAETAATAATLRSHGVDVLDYPVRTQMIDHVKLLVVDDAVAVVGGINWGVGSERNHDVDAIVHGPVVANLQRVFVADMATSGRRVVIPDGVADPAIIVTTTLPGTDIRPLVISAIETATSTLDIELFVVTDSGIVNAIAAAQTRGVTIRVLLDPSQPSSDASAAALVAAHVPLRHYSSGGEKLHAKFVVADMRRIVFGSANWSKGGFVRNHECDAEIVNSPALAADFTRAVDADWAAAA